MIEYKGYTGFIEVDAEAGILFGHVLYTRDVITFEAESVAQVIEEFRTSVDDYLALCKEEGREPDRPFSGKFHLRMDPDLHRDITLAAERAGKSLNAWIAETLRAAVSPVSRSSR